MGGRRLLVVGLVVMGACDSGEETSVTTVAVACSPACEAGSLCDTSGGGGPGEGVCVENICGNGSLEGEEACDTGEANSDTEPDACRTDCTLARCGDEVVDAGETCDNGGQDNDDGCLDTCACAEGYGGESGSCVDVDECTGGIQKCGANATCTNRVGSFHCFCKSGYSGDGITCSDVDECATGVDDCDSNATCTNVPGGFTCACLTGYSGDGKACSDVDECATGVADCDSSATCTNVPGGFTCACPTGYSGDGTTCSDVDECMTGVADCDSSATCTNAPGGFTCACPTGYSGDGQRCSPCPAGEVNPVPGTTSCTPCESGTYDDGDETCAAWAPACLGDQQETQAPSATEDRVCGQREEVDYCAGSPCQNGGVCTNGFESFTCDCLSGYSGDTCEVSPENEIETLDLCEPNRVEKVPNLTRSPRAVWVGGVRVGSNGNKRTVVQWDPVPGANHYRVQPTLHLSGEDWVIPAEADHYHAFESGFEFDQANEGWSFSVEGEVAVNYSRFFRDNDEVTIQIKAVYVDANGGETLLHTYPEFRFRLGTDYVVGKPLVWGSAGDQQATLRWCKLEAAESYEIAYGTEPSHLTKSVSVDKLSESEQLFHTVTGLNNDETVYFVLYPLRHRMRGQPSETLEVTPSDGSKLPDADISISALTLNQATSLTLWPPDEGAPAVDRIAGKPGVFRVFLRHNLPDSPRVSVQLNLFYEGELLTSLKKSAVLGDSTGSDAGSSDFSVLFELSDPSWLRVGTSFSVEVDPAFEIAESNDTNNRYPAGDALSSFGFVEASLLRIKLIGTRSPHGQSREIDEGVINQIREAFLDMYPIKAVSVEVAEDGAGTPIVLDLTPFEVDSSLGEVVDNELMGPLAVVNDYRSADINGDAAKMNVYYYALVKQGAGLEGSYTSGLALRNTLGDSFDPQLAALGGDAADTMINTMLHEVGHSHSAKHVQGLDEITNRCGESGDSDTTYPYNNYDQNGASDTEYGRIGKTGYIASQKRLVDKTYYNDIMSYCAYRNWISDYTYTLLRLFSKELEGRYGAGGSPEGLSNERAAAEIQGMHQRDGTRLAGSYSQGEWSLGSVLHGKGRASSVEKDDAFQLQVKTEDGVHWVSVHPVALDHSESRVFEVFVPDQSPLLEVAIYNQGAQEVIKVRESSSRFPAIEEVPVVPLGDDTWRLQATGPVNRRVVRLFRAAAQQWFTLAVDRGAKEVSFHALREDVLEVQWNQGLGVRREYINLSGVRP